MGPLPRRIAADPRLSPGLLKRRATDRDLETIVPTAGHGSKTGLFHGAVFTKVHREIRKIITKLRFVFFNS